MAVAFATGAPYDQRARDAGFEAVCVGPPETFREEWAPRFPGFERLVGDDQRRFFLTEIFANLELEPRASDLDVVVDAWRPDVLVHELAELAAPLVAAAHRISCVDVSYGRLIPRALLQAAGTAAAPHWRARGLAPHPVAGLFDHLYVDTCPPSLQDPELANLPTVQAMRPAAAEPTAAVTPEWLAHLDGRPLVYVTMGTVWNRGIDLFARTIEALRDLPIGIVVTIGHQNDPDLLGPQPDNVLVRRYVPQAELLGRCDAVVSHGGSGTILGALASGLPLLVMPQGADQYANAAAVTTVGAGRSLDRDEASVDTIRAALRDLLGDPAYRLAAQRIQQEIRDMPSADHTVNRIRTLQATTGT